MRSAAVLKINVRAGFFDMGLRVFKNHAVSQRQAKRLIKFYGFTKRLRCVFSDYSSGFPILQIERGHTLIGDIVKAERDTSRFQKRHSVSE